jgi:hypothetical protein
MWIEENHHFVRTPVPKSFDRCVERLQDADSVLFASISLASLLDSESREGLRSGRTESPPTQFRDQHFEAAKACRSLNRTSRSDDSEKAALRQRIQELEEANAQKDQEIARLEHEFQIMRSFQGQFVQKSEPEDASYKQEYEALKFQYDKLREALAVNGKVRRVRVKSVQVVKLAM